MISYRGAWSNCKRDEELLLHNATLFIVSDVGAISDKVAKWIDAISEIVDRTIDYDGVTQFMICRDVLYSVCAVCVTHSYTLNSDIRCLPYRDNVKDILRKN